MWEKAPRSSYAAHWFYLIAARAVTTPAIGVNPCKDSALTRFAACGTPLAWYFSDEKFLLPLMPAPYQILDLDIDPQNWTPIITPFGCNNVAVRNPLNVDLKIKTDLARADQDIVPALAQEGIIAPLSGAPFWRDTAESPYRFMPASTVAYLQTTSGTGAVKIRFVR